MAQNTTAGERTEPKRFADDVDPSELIEGDRISRVLVAQNPNQLGEAIRPNPPEADEAPPKTQLTTATQIRKLDDSHSALLIDPDSGTIVRASKIQRKSAVTQAEADWTVREVGTKVNVESVDELEVADNDDPVDDELGYVSDWVEILFGDMAAGHFDYEDERRLNGSTLTLEDFDGRKAVATISLK